MAQLLLELLQDCCQHRVSVYCFTAFLGHSSEKGLCSYP